MINNEKYLNLVNYLKKLDKVILAFSGGVGSTFLLAAAKEALGYNLKAVTIKTPYIPKWEIEEAKQFATEIGVIFEILETPVIEQIKNNPEDRCYLCKKAVFSQIKAIAQREGYNYVIDGTNFDDIDDYRPGLKALRELNIKSPLLECQLNKQEIRSLSKELGLSTWDKPPYACLLTRIPFGSELKEEDFIKIEKAEKYMMERGFRSVRVRCHDDLARIEVDKNDTSKLFNKLLLEEISVQLKGFGFKYVTLDLEGYKKGSFNAAISNN